jgi:hypothetical protein
VPQPRRLVACFPPRRPGFNPRSYEIYGKQSGIWAIYPFPLPILIPQNIRYLSGADTTGPLVAGVPSGYKLTQLNELEEYLYLKRAKEYVLISSRNVWSINADKSSNGTGTKS